MNRLSFWAGLGLFWVGTEAHAIVGPGAVSHRPREWRNEYAYLCTLEVDHEKNEQDQGVGFCTGELIAPDTILTAAHCFREGVKPQGFVRCGRGNRNIQKVFLPREKGWDSARGELKLGWDIAIVKVKRAFLDLPILKMAENEEDYFHWSELKPKVSCEVQAFGTNDAGNTGDLNTWELTAMSLRSYGHSIELKDPKTKYLVTSVAGGDSGGALICAREGKEPELIGVVVGLFYELNNIQLRTSNYFTSVWTEPMHLLQKMNRESK